MLLRTLAATLLLSITALAAQAQPAPRFCVVAVKDGTPTEKDINQAWRMLTKVVMLPGVPRPVIYAMNRGGVWTIDETRAFVPYGGEFPSNSLWDGFVRDPDTGRILGVSNFSGVFALDRGETQFKKLYPIDDKVLKHPYSASFIPRMNGFVISDSNGLFLLNRAGELSALPVSDRTTLGVPFKAYDLPAFGGLLISASGRGETALPYAAVRFDDGQIVRGPTFDRFDSISKVEITSDGTLALSGGRKTYAMEINPRPAGQIAQGQSFELEGERKAVRRDRLEAPSIGKVLNIQRRNGIYEMEGDTRKGIKLPFDPSQEPIEQAAEMPESKVVLIFTPNAIYTLDADNNVSEVANSRGVGRTPLNPTSGIIPVRNEMIVLGANALHLVLDTRFAGEAACRVN
jgi:hypothetical protein